MEARPASIANASRAAARSGGFGEAPLLRARPPVGPVGEATLVELALVAAGRAAPDPSPVSPSDGVSGREVGNVCALDQIADVACGPSSRLRAAKRAANGEDRTPDLDRTQGRVPGRDPGVALEIAKEVLGKAPISGRLAAELDPRRGYSDPTSASVSKAQDSPQASAALQPDVRGAAVCPAGVTDQAIAACGKTGVQPDLAAIRTSEHGRAGVAPLDRQVPQRAFGALPLHDKSGRRPGVRRGGGCRAMSSHQPECSEEQ